MLHLNEGSALKLPPLRGGNPRYASSLRCGALPLARRCIFWFWCSSCLLRGGNPRYAAAPYLWRGGIFFGFGVRLASGAGKPPLRCGVLPLAWWLLESYIAACLKYANPNPAGAKCQRRLIWEIPAHWVYMAILCPLHRLVPPTGN